MPRDGSEDAFETEPGGLGRTDPEKIVQNSAARHRVAEFFVSLQPKRAHGSNFGF
jgi:hypothetical protein